MKTLTHRRRFLTNSLMAGIIILLSAASPVTAEPLFGDPAHKVVYQFNKADPDYMEHVMFSVGALLRKYGDDIHIVVTAIGPGIHILAKDPQRPVPDIIKKRVASLASYGVSFHACGNTMKSLGWAEKDILDLAEVVEIGADDLVLLQEQGYSYISW
jgi:intracellular sulfur oxidation DsrE/DsrF family protein